jgi:hypothetical protein
MPSEKQGDPRAASGRKPRKDPPAPETPSPPAGPPISSDGLELPRSSDC